LGKEQGMTKTIEGCVGRLAGETVRKKVMEGSEKITAKTGKAEISEWVKGAMNRLDSLVDERVRTQIMENCGYKCSEVNRKVIEGAKTRRKRCKSEEEFLEAEQQRPLRGTRLVREGNVLYQFYTPRTYAKSLRCYCGLLRGLPADETISRTYCHCSKGFVKRFWEGALGRSVRVELIYSAVSGADECKFAIHL
jgi:hypothetical protein